MSERQPRLFLWTSVFGAGGAVLFGFREGWSSAGGFALGAAASLSSLWFYDRLAHALATGRSQGGARAFVFRYLLLIAAGYVIVNALGVRPLPVILGLFASTAGVLLATLLHR